MKIFIIFGVIALIFMISITLANKFIAKEDIPKDWITIGVEDGKLYASGIRKGLIITKIDKGSSLSVEGCDVHIKNIEGEKFNSPKIKIIKESNLTVDKAKNADFKVNYGANLNVTDAIFCKFKVDRSKVNIINKRAPEKNLQEIDNAKEESFTVHYGENLIINDADDCKFIVDKSTVDITSFEKEDSFASRST